MKMLTRSLVRHAHGIAREVGARVIMLHADVIEEDADLSSLIEDVNFRVILVSHRPGFLAPVERKDMCSVVHVPDIAMTRAGQVKVATLLAAAESLVKAGDRILCLTGIDGSGSIDTIMVLDMGTEIELFSASTADPLPKDVTPAVFERVLTLASELGVEGREGRTVGTLFVVGDSDRVLSQSHQLVFNPFHGYPEGERNILDHRLEETIKEFSAIDGAFVVRGDGVVLAAGRYRAPRSKLEEPLPQGLGTRHEAAASVTVTTDSIAVCVSQSTGTVSIFRSPAAGDRTGCERPSIVAARRPVRCPSLATGPPGARLADPQRRVAGRSGRALRRSGRALRQSGRALRQSGRALRRSGRALRRSGRALRQSGRAPGRSCRAAGPARDRSGTGGSRGRRFPGSRAGGQNGCPGAGWSIH